MQHLLLAVSCKQNRIDYVVVVVVVADSDDDVTHWLTFKRARLGSQLKALCSMFYAKPKPTVSLRVCLLLDTICLVSIYFVSAIDLTFSLSLSLS